MRILYMLSTGTADATKATLPLHLAVNGSHVNGDEVAIDVAVGGRFSVGGDGEVLGHALSYHEVREFVIDESPR